MKRWIPILLSFALATVASGQSMHRTQTIPVNVSSVSVRSIYDIDAGQTACRNAIAAQCDDLSFSDCPDGVSYTSPRLDSVQYIGYTSAAGIRHNHYRCSGACIATCNDPLPPPPPPDPEQQEEGRTPIILDLGRRNLDLTSAAEGISFDIDGDGVPETIAWVDPFGGDALLAMDRDGDGRIADGRELFGSAAPQPPSLERNGFLALAAYDDPLLGGDGNGEITPYDGVWQALRAWIDRNQNGVSDDGELLSLDQAGVLSLGLEYHELRKKDRHGNQYRYRSWMRLIGDSNSRHLYDVIFDAP